MPPARELHCGKLREAAGADLRTTRREPSNRVFSRCGGARDPPPGASPILAEAPEGNNPPDEVIHRASRLECRVFHSIHIFTTSFGVVSGMRRKRRQPQASDGHAGCGPAPAREFVDTSRGPRLQSLGFAPARPPSRRPRCPRRRMTPEWSGECEENVPAEQPQAREDTWFPRPYGHQRRPPRAGRSAPQGPRGHQRVGSSADGPANRGQRANDHVANRHRSPLQARATGEWPAPRASRVPDSRRA
jgi:hypothetical protein